MAQQNVTAFVYDRKGRILSIGKNSYVKTHPLQAKLAAKVNLSSKVFLHAEVDALVRCKDWTKAHKIVVIRIGKNGQPINAKPCPICQEALRLANITIVEHS